MVRTSTTHYELRTTHHSPRTTRNPMSDINDHIPHTKAELLFPAHLISSLRDLRGEEWRALVDRVSVLPETHPDCLAFILMMIELDGCLRCNSNNFKFLRGCFLCATQTVQSFKGTDNDLIEMYNKAKHDLGVHLQQGHLQQGHLQQGLKPGEMKIAA